MNDQTANGLIHEPGPLLSTDLPTRMWPRCHHCGIPIDGNRLREANPEPGVPARVWHADKPDCRAVAEETAQPQADEQEHPDHHADLVTASEQFEMDQADEARYDAGELG